MKRILPGLVAVLATQAVLFAQPSPHQPAWLARPVTIRSKDVRVSDIVAMIQKATRIRMEISNSDRELLQARIAIDICDDRIDHVLRLALATAGLSFRVVDDKTIHVFAPVVPPELPAVQVCHDRIEEILKPLLRGAEPPPLELIPVERSKPDPR